LGGAGLPREGEACLGEEVIDDLVLFNRHGVQEDVLERVDLPCFHKPTKLGDGVPSILVGISAAARASTAATTTWYRVRRGVK
jgi:hypothetical protein